MFTGEQGRYRFRTIQPEPIPAAPGIITSRCRRPVSGSRSRSSIFPERPANARDDFFHRELLMRVAGPGPGMAACFDFVINMR